MKRILSAWLPWLTSRNLKSEEISSLSEKQFAIQGLGLVEGGICKMFTRGVIRY
jgi:hypothetical protein